MFWRCILFAIPGACVCLHCLCWFSHSYLGEMYGNVAMCLFCVNLRVHVGHHGSSHYIHWMDSFPCRFSSSIPKDCSAWRKNEKER